MQPLALEKSHNGFAHRCTISIIEDLHSYPHNGNILWQMIPLCGVANLQTDLIYFSFCCLHSVITKINSYLSDDSDSGYTTSS